MILEHVKRFVKQIVIIASIRNLLLQSTGSGILYTAAVINFWLERYLVNQLGVYDSDTTHLRDIA
jgi:hypothetical protein